MLLAVEEIKNHGNRDFLDRTYRKYYQNLCSLAGSIICNRESAGDIVTTAMLSLFSKISFLRSLDEVERVAYLRATVRNAAYKQYNAQKRRGLTETDNIDSLLFSLPGPDHEDPANIALKNEEYRQVREAIATLGADDRQLLYLKYSAQLSAKEIAEMTNAPSEAAVQMRLSRARHKVLLLLEERGWEHDGYRLCRRTGQYADFYQDAGLLEQSFSVKRFIDAFLLHMSQLGPANGGEAAEAGKP